MRRGPGATAGRALAPFGLAVALCLPLPAAAEGPPASPSPAAEPSPGARRTIAESIEENVERVLREHEEPCERSAREGVPCFPVSVEVKGERFSVAEDLRRFRTDGRPAPGAPTNAEVHSRLSGGLPLAPGGVGGDPVCAVKSLVRSLKGGSNTFYLYRLRSSRGEHPLLTDRRLDPQALLATPGVTYEYLGTYSGPCEAVAAWRKTLRETTPPPPHARR